MKKLQLSPKQIKRDLPLTSPPKKQGSCTSYCTLLADSRHYAYKRVLSQKSALAELNGRKFTIFNVWVIPVTKVKVQPGNLRNLLLVCLMLVSSLKKSVSYTSKTEWKKLPICIDYLLSLFHTVEFSSPVSPFPTFFFFQNKHEKLRKLQKLQGQGTHL